MLLRPPLRPRRALGATATFGGEYQSDTPPSTDGSTGSGNRGIQGKNAPNPDEMFDNFESLYRVSYELLKCPSQCYIPTAQIQKSLHNRFSEHNQRPATAQIDIQQQQQQNQQQRQPNNKVGATAVRSSHHQRMLTEIGSGFDRLCTMPGRQQIEAPEQQRLITEVAISGEESAVTCKNYPLQRKDLLQPQQNNNNQQSVGVVQRSAVSPGEQTLRYLESVQARNFRSVSQMEATAQPDKPFFTNKQQQNNIAERSVVAPEGNFTQKYFQSKPLFKRRERMKSQYDGGTFGTQNTNFLHSTLEYDNNNNNKENVPPVRQTVGQQSGSNNSKSYYLRPEQQQQQQQQQAAIQQAQPFYSGNHYQVTRYSVNRQANATHQQTRFYEQFKDYQSFEMYRKNDLSFRHF